MAIHIGNLGRKDKSHFHLGLCLIEGPDRGLGIVTQKREDGCFKILFVEKNIETGWLDSLFGADSLEQSEFISRIEKMVYAKKARIQSLQDEIAVHEKSLGRMLNAFDFIDKLVKNQEV